MTKKAASGSHTLEVATPAPETGLVWPKGLDPGKALETLKESFGLRREAPENFLRVWMDTWDWRLYRQGFTLEEERSEDGTLLAWRKSGSTPLFRVPGPAPRFATDLPHGSFRSRLEEVVEMRALMPVASTYVKRVLYSVLDDSGKTVCRVCAESYRAGESPTGAPLGSRITVERIYGYEEEHGRVIALLGESLSPATGGVLEDLLAATGKKPSKYTGKVKVPLTEDVPAVEAARMILLNLFETMNVNEEGLKADVDSEFLHDYRVAVRRTRSALGQIKGVLPPSLTARFAPEFSWLGTITSPTRDLDVHLLDFPRYRAALPPGHRDDLAPLLALIENRKKTEHAKLVESLGSGRYLKFRREWEGKLLKPISPSPLAPLGKLPIGEVAGQRIHKVFKRAVRQGKALRETSPAADFHELRKTCKKLRYLIEFFQTLYPPAEVKQFLVFLKGLQDNLGEFQDLQVQSEALRNFSEELWRERASGPSSLIAIGMLLEKLALRGEEVRAEFSQKFSVFAGEENRANFKALFADRAIPEGGGG